MNGIEGGAGGEPSEGLLWSPDKGWGQLVEGGGKAAHGHGCGVGGTQEPTDEGYVKTGMGSLVGGRVVAGVQGGEGGDSSSAPAAP